MSPELTTILMILSLFILLAGFPLAFGLGTVGLLFGLITSGNAYLYMIPMRVMSGILSEYIFAAVPLFIFMGTMMQTSGVAERAFKILNKWMSGINGGLALATVILAMLFAATTGVVGASETAIGLLAVPSMLKANYSKSLASGCVCAGGTLGILIPPSVMLILYAPMAGVSVIQMFSGAIIPGLLLGGVYILYIIIRTAISPEMGPKLPPEEKLAFFSKESLVQGFRYLVPPLFLIFLVLGSIFFGVASPTEAGAVGSLGAIAPRAVLYKRLTVGEFQGKLLYHHPGYVDDHLHRHCSDHVYRGVFVRGMRAGDHGFHARPGIRSVGGFHHDAGYHPLSGDVYRLDRHLDDHRSDLFAHAARSGFRFPVGRLVICTSLQISFLTPPFALPPSSI